MNDDPHADDAAEMLTEIGYLVERIPEAADERADLWAHAGADSLTVEVKSRVDDEDIAGEIEDSPGKVVTRGTPIVRTDVLARIIRTARSQIASSQAEFPGLAVLWFRPDPKLGISEAAELMIANLLGVRSVSFNVDGRFGFAQAFSSARTDFHRFKDLVAAVIESDEGLRLLVNPYSEQKTTLRESLLYQHFAAYNAALDLDLLQSDETHFVLRSNVARDDEAGVLAELARQHPGYRFAFSELHSFKGFTRVRRTDGTK